MKAKELKKILSEINDEFEIQASHSHIDNEASYPYTLLTYKITGVADVGHSDKIISLSLSER